jgi:uncharacterized protein YciI
MIDPFTAYLRMAKAGLQVQANWMRALETLQASQSVIEVRTAKMREAASMPWRADTAEFSRIIPEKVEAFGLSADAVMRETMRMHAAWLSQLQRVGFMIMSGRFPSVAETSIFASQTLNYAVGAMYATARMGRKALAPVHQTATRNARRLDRGALSGRSSSAL